MLYVCFCFNQNATVVSTQQCFYLNSYYFLFLSVKPICEIQKLFNMPCHGALQSGSFFFCDKNGPVNYVRVTDQAVKRSRYYDDQSMRETCIYLCFFELVLITRTIYLYMNFNWAIKKCQIPHASWASYTGKRARHTNLKTLNY